MIAAAPTIADFHGEASAAHFGTVTAALDRLGIPYRIAPQLVRGLDYYVRTTYEFAGGTLDSAQNALGGGGRYDGLVEALGGPPTPGIGFALGVERILIACDDEGVFAPQDRSADVFVVDTTGGLQATLISDELRAAGLAVERAFDGRSMKSQMKAADRSGAAVAVIIGERRARGRHGRGSTAPRRRAALRGPFGSARATSSTSSWRLARHCGATPGANRRRSALGCASTLG